jgi:hypothetical protein
MFVTGYLKRHFKTSASGCYSKCAVIEGQRTKQQRAAPFQLENSREPAGRLEAASTRTCNEGLSRRAFLELLGYGLLVTNRALPMGAALEKSPGSLPTSAVPEHQTRPNWTTRFAIKAHDAIYRLTPDKGEAAVLSIDEDACLDALAKQADLIFIGDHPRSQTDHAMEARIVAAMALRLAPSQDYSLDKSALSVALDAFEQHHQSLLDDYIDGRIQEEELYERSKWDDRCVWPYERYLNLLRTCRSLGIRLVALNMQSIHRKALQQHGIAYLKEHDEVRRLYFPDWKNVSDDLQRYAASPGYRLYASQVLEPHFATLRRHGFLDFHVSYQAFTEATLVQDAAMADVLQRRLASNKNQSAGAACRCRALACCEMPHVAFGHGIRGLLEYWQSLEMALRDGHEANQEAAGLTFADSARVQDTSKTAIRGTSARAGSILRVQTLLLNPTVTDAGSRVLSGDETRDWLLGKRPRRLRLALSRNMIEEIPPPRTEGAALDSEREERAQRQVDSSLNHISDSNERYLSIEAKAPVDPLLLGDYLWISASKKGRIRV